MRKFLTTLISLILGFSLPFMAKADTAVDGAYYMSYEAYTFAKNASGHKMDYGTVMLRFVGCQYVKVTETSGYFKVPYNGYFQVRTTDPVILNKLYIRATRSDEAVIEVTGNTGASGSGKVPASGYNYSGCYNGPCHEITYKNVGPSKSGSATSYINVYMVGIEYIPTSKVTVDVTPSSTIVEMEGNTTLSATVSPFNYKNQNITWKSDNPNVATVDAKGVVTGVNAGKATITGAWDLATGECQIEVVERPQTISNGVYYLISKADEDYALSVPGSEGSGIKAQTQKFNRNNLQKWEVENVGNAWVRIHPYSNINYSLNNASNQIVEGNDISILDNVGEDKQLWLMDEVSDDTFVIRNRKDPTYVAALSTSFPVNGTSVKLYNYKGSANQKWKLEKVAEDELILDFYLNKTNIYLFPGDEYQLIATIEPTRIGSKKINWTSSDTNVAAVDDFGRVSVKSGGTSVITASVGSHTAQCVVGVSPFKIESFRITEDKVSLSNYCSTQLHVEATPAEAAEHVEWSSGNPDIATVDASGKVSAVSPGKAVITSTCGLLPATCEVEVSSNTFKLSDSYLFLAPSYNYQLNVKFSVEPETMPEIKWTSSNTNVATVDNKGLVTTKNAGQCVITASLDGFSTQCEIKVEMPAVSDFVVDMTKNSMVVGEKATLRSIITASSYPEGLNARWRSTDGAVLSVEDLGNNRAIVTAIGPGTASIIAYLGSREVKHQVHVAENSWAGTYQKAYFDPEYTDFDYWNTSGSSSWSGGDIHMNDDIIVNFQNPQLTTYGGLRIPGGTGKIKISSSKPDLAISQINIRVSNSDYQGAVGADWGNATHSSPWIIWTPKDPTEYNYPVTLTVGRSSAGLNYVVVGEIEVYYKKISNPEGPSPELKPEKVTITGPDSFTWNKGGKVQLSATVTPEIMSGKVNIVWSSSNENIASVDNTGLVTLNCNQTEANRYAEDYGDCYISAKISEYPGITDQYLLYQWQEEENPNNPGADNKTYKVTFNFTEPSTLNSSYGKPTTGEDIIDLTGKAFTKDNVTISFSNNGGSTPPRLYSGSNSNEWSLRFYNKNNVKISVPATMVLVNVDFDTNNTRDWSFSSGNLNNKTWKASGDEYYVDLTKTATGNNPSVSTITVKYKARSAGTIPVTDMILDKEALTLRINDSETLTATIEPAEASSKEVTWESDNVEIATVSSNGTVTAKNYGTATITATSGAVSAKCVVNVIPSSIGISTLSMENTTGKTALKTSESLFMDAVVEPHGEYAGNFVWTVNNAVIDIEKIYANGSKIKATVKDNVLPQTSTITIALAEDPSISATYTVSISDLLLGDSDDDGEITLSDIDTIANEILETRQSENDNFCFINADIDKNKEINILDLTATTNIVLDKNEKKIKRQGNPIDSHNEQGRLLYQWRNVSELDIMLEYPDNFVSLQSEILLPEGIEIIGITKGGQTDDHIISSNVVEGGTLKVLVYSYVNNSFVNTITPLLTIVTNGEDSENDLKFKRNLAADGEANGYELEAVEVGNTSSIVMEEINHGCPVVYGETNAVKIENAEGCKTLISTIDGKIVREYIPNSDKERIEIESGYYIVVVGNAQFKIIVK